ncbi:unnamed protein product [Toxocara canis]|uniref:Pectinesterase n=1 Tax=Toxocara canis TaxID=6265 RepID=A0A183UQ36_TOXCA|nr:unnamed protein product [Toxocara canis]
MIVFTNAEGAIVQMCFVLCECALDHTTMHIKVHLIVGVHSGKSVARYNLAVFLGSILEAYKAAFVYCIIIRRYDRMRSVLRTLDVNCTKGATACDIVEHRWMISECEED